MVQQPNDPVIRITDLPDYPETVALHGARLASGSELAVNDDLWVIAVILVYESGG